MDQDRQRYWAVDWRAAGDAQGSMQGCGRLRDYGMPREQDGVFPWLDDLEQRQPQFIAWRKRRMMQVRTDQERYKRARIRYPANVQHDRRRALYEDAMVRAMHRRGMYAEEA